MAGGDPARIVRRPDACIVGDLARRARARRRGARALRRPRHRRPNKVSKKLPPPELALCCTSATPAPTLPGGRGMPDVEVGAAAMRCGGVYCGCARGGAEAR